MKQVIFHIGYHKCGSTLLQRQFFQKHHQLEYVSRKNYVDELLNCYALSRDVGILEAHIQNAKLDNVVFSCEEFLGNFHNGGLNGNFTKSLMGELTKKFPNSKFIIVIRNHKDLISSLYGQYVKEGGCLSEKRFLFNNMREFRYRGPGFCFEPFKYSTIIEFMLTLIEPENLKIVLFEDLVSEYERVTLDICQFLGVEPQLKKSLRIENEGLSALGIQINRFINLFCEGDVPQNEKLFSVIKQNPDGNSRLTRLKYILSLDRIILKRFSRKYKLSKITQKFIDEYYSCDNKRLEDILSLPLKSKGYVIDR